jgi:hypothetical protein
LNNRMLSAIVTQNYTQNCKAILIRTRQNIPARFSGKNSDCHPERSGAKSKDPVALP